jgi:hypothetical protein
VHPQAATPLRELQGSLRGINDSLHKIEQLIPDVGIGRPVAGREDDVRSPFKKQNLGEKRTGKMEGGGAQRRVGIFDPPAPSQFSGGRIQSPCQGGFLGSDTLSFRTLSHSPSSDRFPECILVNVGEGRQE